MTVWWGLAGLLGLLGCCGLLRSHRSAGAAVEGDPLARYPVAREPATPNADAAHTPLMTPAITPEMLAGHPGPAGPRPDAVVPESGTIAGEIPAPRPQSGGPEERPVAASAGQAAGGSVPGPGTSGVPQPPKHALRTEASAPETAGVPRARAPEPGATPQPQPNSTGLGGTVKRLLRRA